MSDITKLTTLSVYFIVFACVILPTGKIIEYPVKHAASLITIGLVFINFLLKKRLKKKEVCFMFSFMFFIAFYSFIGMTLNSNPLYSVLTQISALFATMLMVFLPMHLIVNKYVNVENFLRSVIIVIFIFCFLKSALSLALTLEIITVDLLIKIIGDVFNGRIITISTSFFTRLHFPADYLIPGYLFCIICQKKLRQDFGKIATIIFLFVGIFAVVISFSRIIWLYSFVSIVLSYNCICDNKSNKKNIFKNRLRQRIIEIVVIIPLLLIVFGTDKLNSQFDFVAERYTGNDAFNSDSIRLSMAPVLISQFLNNPIFGSGMGAYNKFLVRFPETPWNYELQWISLLVQFGIIGLLYFALILFFIFRTLLVIHRRISISAAILFAMWLGTGFFNCFLLTSQTGVVYTTFLLMGYTFKRNKEVGVFEDEEKNKNYMLLSSAIPSNRGK
jgi:O-antigen ligase